MACWNLCFRKANKIIPVEDISPQPIYSAVPDLSNIPHHEFPIIPKPNCIIPIPGMLCHNGKFFIHNDTTFSTISLDHILSFLPSNPLSFILTKTEVEIKTEEGKGELDEESKHSDYVPIQIKTNSSLKKFTHQIEIN